MTLFLPVVRAAGKRYRSRLRYVGGFRFIHWRDDYPEGTAHSFRLGTLLLVVLVDVK